MDIATLQRLMACTWPGLEQQRLGEWELRAAGGFTGRANSASPVGDPGLPLEQAVDAVEEYYRSRGLPPRLQVPSALPGAAEPNPCAAVAALIDQRGWSAEPWTLVMTRPVAPPEAVPADGLELRWSSSPDDAWLNQYHYAGARLPPAAKAVITSAPADYLTVYRDGALVGIGRAAVAGTVVALTAIEVLAEQRRRGVGAVITEALAARGADRGAQVTALQVFEHNAAAVRLYQRLGYRPHHHYRYRAAV